MKVAISSSGSSLDAQIDPRLGRCECLLFVDPETLEYEAVSNEKRSLSGGAGIQTARIIAEQGTKVVLTGHCGPNAIDALTTAGVQVLTGFTGTAREAVEQYKRGETTPVEQSPAPDHSEIGAPRPVLNHVGPQANPLTEFLGRSMELGRGRGMGMGF
jgi:predicted Fe-Mo cluster-binding NifX family protein